MCALGLGDDHDVERGNCRSLECGKYTADGVQHLVRRAFNWPAFRTHCHDGSMDHDVDIHMECTIVVLCNSAISVAHRWQRLSIATRCSARWWWIILFVHKPSPPSHVTSPQLSHELTPQSIYVQESLWLPCQCDHPQRYGDSNGALCMPFCALSSTRFCSVTDQAHWRLIG
jgi:hypothetical protein